MRVVDVCGAKMFTEGERAVLRLLSDGESHGAAELEALPGVSGSAAEIAGVLAENGLPVDAAPGGGYRLRYAPAPYDRELLKTRPNLIYFDSVASTNQYLLAKSFLPEGTVVAADFQTAGRGRRGRSFVSAFGAQITFSHAAVFPGLGGASGLSIAAGVAVAGTLARAGEKNVRLKWPNDVYVDGRKAAGILVETAARPGGVLAVTGVGLNTSAEFARAPGIREAVGREPGFTRAAGADGRGRAALLLALCRSLDRTAAAFRESGLAGFAELFGALDISLNRRVVLSDGRRRLRGTDRGVASDGSLRLETDDGEIVLVRAGDMSLRPGED